MLFGLYVVVVEGQKQCFTPDNKLLYFREN